MTWLPVNDKVVHMGLYGVFGGTLAWGWIRSRVGWPHASLIALGAFYGATDEWHQAFVPGRSVSFYDWIADVTGVLLGYSVILAMISYRETRASQLADPGSRNEGA